MVSEYEKLIRSIPEGISFISVDSKMHTITIIENKQVTTVGVNIPYKSMMMLYAIYCVLFGYKIQPTEYIKNKGYLYFDDNHSQLPIDSMAMKLLGADPYDILEFENLGYEWRIKLNKNGHMDH